MDMGDIAAIKSIPILDVARNMNFNVVKVGKFYSLKEHDSVIIDSNKNRFWRNSTGDNGSVIDFVMHFLGIDLKSGIEWLNTYAKSNGLSDLLEKPRTAEKSVQNNVSELKKFVLPQRADTISDVENYLINVRKINPQIVKDFERDKHLYQDTHKNCVFVSYNANGTADFACVRGTNPEKKYIADVPGNNYKTCFYLEGKRKQDKVLIITESVIDMMSYATHIIDKSNGIGKDNGKDYRDCDYLALSGVSKFKEAVTNALKNHKEISNIVLALDNDEAGLTACEKIQELLKKLGFQGKVSMSVPKVGKDWNEYVVMKHSQNSIPVKPVRIQKRKDIEKESER